MYFVGTYVYSPVASTSPHPLRLTSYMQYCASYREQVAVAIIYRRIEQYIR